MHSRYQLNFHQFFDAKQASELSMLDHSYFPYPWSEGAWSDLSKTSGMYCGTLIREGDKVIGFSLYLLSPLESLAHLLKILIVPESRGFGLGQSILEFERPYLKSLGYQRSYLEVAAKNVGAIAVYQRFGFQTIHRQAHYYSDGQDALMMELLL